MSSHSEPLGLNTLGQHFVHATADPGTPPEPELSRPYLGLLMILCFVFVAAFLLLPLDKMKLIICFQRIDAVKEVLAMCPTACCANAAHRLLLLTCFVSGGRIPASAALGPSGMRASKAAAHSHEPASGVSGASATHSLRCDEHRRSVPRGMCLVPSIRLPHHTDLFPRVW